jgi:transcriptional regulator with XRE-family HTH domain
MKKETLKVAKNMHPPKINEYHQFIEWYAFPESEKKPKTQNELAKVLGVNYVTLSNWKKKKGFKEAVDNKIKEWVADRNKNVIDAVYKAALDGNAASQRLWAEWQQNWIPKTAHIEAPKWHIKFNYPQKKENTKQLPDINKSRVIKYVK